jgi:hypothetical protein
MDHSSHTDVSDKKVEVKNFVDHFEGEGYINWSGRSNSSAMWPDPFRGHDLDKMRPPSTDWWCGLSEDEELIRVNFVPCCDDMDDG